MAPLNPSAVRMALGSLGVLSLAQMASAEASSLDIDREPCQSCDPKAVEDSAQAQKPVPAVVVSPSVVPAAKKTPDFSEASSAAAPKTAAGGADPPLPGSSQNDMNSTFPPEVIAAATAEPAASVLAPAPAPEPLQKKTQFSAEPAGAGGETTMAGMQEVEGRGDLQEAVATAEVADTVASGMERDGFERTAGESGLVGSAHPTVASGVERDGFERTAGESGLVGSAHQTGAGAAAGAIAKRPISLPQVVSSPELSTTHVMSGRNRSTSASSIAAGHYQQSRISEPVIPVFERPRTEGRSHQKSVAPRLTATQAELAGVSTTSRDLLGPNETLAQADASASASREDLLVEPLATDPVPTVRHAPSPNAGIPSAFGAAWGDLFVSVTAAGADRVRNEVDGSISAGLGLGDPRTAVGVELAYNLLSIRNFGSNGSFDAKVHREIFANETTQAAVAAGWNNFVNYGDDVDGTESSPYGVVSAAHLLQPNNPANRLPITGTLGVGGGNFSDENADVGVLAGVGLQVDPRLSLNAAWSGVGINVGASVVPFPDIPLTLNAIYGDITNNTEAGSVATFTIGYGFNFGPSF